MTSSEFDPEELIVLAEDDPEACVARCDEILESADHGEDAAAAHRAKGVALRHLGRLEESIVELQTAADLFDAAGNEASRAESVISMSASAALTGAVEEGMRLLDGLLDHELPSVRAHALVQRASLVSRTGDLKKALSQYEAALPILEDLDDEDWLSILYGNRGLMYIFAERFDDAETDLLMAKSLLAKQGKTAFVATCVHNLGWLSVWRGDIAKGIETLLEAEQMFQEVGLPHEMVTLDRAYAYMLAGLTRDARETSLAVAAQLESRSAQLDRFDALLIASRAALADGDPSTAHSIASAAVELADSQRRTPWQLMAELVREEAGYATGSWRSDVESIRALAEGLNESLYTSAAVHAWALAALRAIETRNLPAASECLSAGWTDSPELLELPSRLMYALASARFRELAGDRQDAIKVLEDAADLVDEHRLLLSATESRVGVARLTVEVARTGLELIHAAGGSTVEWVDRFRSASLRIAPVVRSQDPELEATLGELRRLTKETAQRQLSGRVSRDDRARARVLEQQIKDMALTKPTAVKDPVHRLTTEQICGTLKDRWMLYLYDAQGSIHGEVLTSRTQRTAVLGPSSRFRTLARHMAAGFRRQFLARSGRERNVLIVRETISELSHALLETVREAEELVVVPPPDLVSLPWSAMASSLRGDLAIVVAPSAGAWVDASKRQLRQRELGVVSGPRLDHGGTEAERVVAVYGGQAETLTGSAATVEASIELMGSCESLHAVAHTHLRHDNPMFSALELADGMMNLYDLEQLDRVPDIVTLSACDSSHGDVVGRHEMYGLTSLLLSRGARSILATVAPIPDSDRSVDAVVRIHSELVKGASPARAVNRAQIASDPSDVDPSLAFVAYGA